MVNLIQVHKKVPPLYRFTFSIYRIGPNSQQTSFSPLRPTWQHHIINIAY